MAYMSMTATASPRKQIERIGTMILQQTLDLTRVVMGLLFDEVGNILIAKRNRKKRYGGLWEFPGGKIEADESVEDALRREIREELNAPIIISEIHTGYFYEHEKLRAFFVPVSGSIRPGDITLCEHEDFRFIRVTEFAAFDFSPYDYGAIRLLRQIPE